MNHTDEHKMTHMSRTPDAEILFDPSVNKFMKPLKEKEIGAIM